MCTRLILNSCNTIVLFTLLATPYFIGKYPVSSAVESEAIEMFSGLSSNGDGDLTTEIDEYLTTNQISNVSGLSTVIVGLFTTQQPEQYIVEPSDATITNDQTSTEKAYTSVDTTVMDLTTLGEKSSTTPVFTGYTSNRPSMTQESFTTGVKKIDVTITNNQTSTEKAYTSDDTTVMDLATSGEKSSTTPVFTGDPISGTDYTSNRPSMTQEGFTTSVTMVDVTITNDQQPEQYIVEPSADSEKFFFYNMKIDIEYNENILDEIHTAFTAEIGEYFEYGDVGGYKYLFVISSEPGSIVVYYEVVFNYTLMYDDRLITAEELLERTKLVEDIDSGNCSLEVNNQTLYIVNYEATGEEYKVNCKGCETGYECLVENGTPYCVLLQQPIGTDETPSEGPESWEVALIALGCVLFVGIVTIATIYFIVLKRSKSAVSPKMDDNMKLTEEQGTTNVVKTGQEGISLEDFAEHIV